MLHWTDGFDDNIGYDIRYFDNLINIVTYRNRYIIVIINTEAGCGAGAPACDSKRNRLWVRLPLEEITYVIY